MKKERTMIQDLTREEMAETFGGALQGGTTSGGKIRVIVKENGKVAFIFA